MSFEELEKQLDKKLIKHLRSIAEKEFIDISVDGVYVLKEGKNDKFLLKLNELETWVDISDNVFLKELSLKMNKEFKDISLVVVKKLPEANVLKFEEWIDKKESLYKEDLLLSSETNAVNSKMVRDRFKDLSTEQKRGSINEFNNLNNLLSGTKIMKSLTIMSELNNLIVDERILENPHKLTGEVSFKIDEALSILSKGSSFAEDCSLELENEYHKKKRIDSNFSWRSLAEYETEVDELLMNYVKACSDVPTYNDIQHTTKYTSIHFANKDFDRAYGLLQNLETSLKSEEYKTEVLRHTEHYEYRSLERVANKVTSAYKEELLSLSLSHEDGLVSVNDFKMDDFHANKKAEADIVKELIRYCHVNNKSLELRNELNLNRSLYLRGGFKESNSGLIFHPSETVEKSFKSKRRP